MSWLSGRNGKLLGSVVFKLVVTRSIWVRMVKSFKPLRFLWMK